MSNALASRSSLLVFIWLIHTALLAIGKSSARNYRLILLRLEDLVVLGEAVRRRLGVRLAGGMLR